MESYFEFQIPCNDDIREQLIAELAEEQYEGFVEHQNGFSAFVPESAFHREVFEMVLQKYGIDLGSIPQTTLAPQNWNAQWEASYEPIVVSNRILIKAPFHQVSENFEHVLTIQPKNTFGTGHHETTQLVLELMLETDFKNKQVFDFGCGTGVLGLMALKLGAEKIVGNDIDAWCVDNIEENKTLNLLTEFEFRKGDLSVLQPNEQFDVILANINKNILMAHMKELTEHLSEHGILIISGFYINDLSDLEQEALSHNLNKHTHVSKNNWCAAAFIRHRIDL